MVVVALLAVAVFLGAALALVFVEVAFAEDAFLAAAVVRAVPVGLEAAADVAVVLGFATDFFATTTGFFAVLVALALAVVLTLVAADLVVVDLAVVVLGVGLADLAVDFAFVAGLF